MLFPATENEVSKKDLGIKLTVGAIFLETGINRIFSFYILPPEMKKSVISAAAPAEFQ